MRGEKILRKVLFVATVVKTHIMEFHVPYLKMFKEMGWETAVAAKNDYDDPEECVIPYCDTYYNIPFERFPVKPQNLKSYKMLKNNIDDGEYDIIHCHTPVGAMLTRLAALDARKKGTKVFYTAHGFHFYKGAPLINWLLYYPVEKWLSRYTDVLITINKEDYKRAKTFKAKETYYVPGVGIDIDRFNTKNETNVREKIRKEFGIPVDATVLLSVGELNKNKNHRVVFQALSQLKNNNIYYIICGRGPLMQKYRDLAKSLGISDNIILTGYRTDVHRFYQTADIFVFPSYREGLPVSMIEAMYNHLPIICTNIRGSKDLAENSGNIIIDNPDNANLFVQGIILLENAETRLEVGDYNREKANDYLLPMVIEQYKKIYQI